MLGRRWALGKPKRARQKSPETGRGKKHILPCRHWRDLSSAGFQTMSPRPAREYISIVQNHPVCGNLLQRPQVMTREGFLEEVVAELRHLQVEVGWGREELQPSFCVCRRPLIYEEKWIR